MLNLGLLILFIAACRCIKDFQKKEKERQEQENPYADLKDLMSDDSWARIREPNPPQNDGVEPPHTLVVSAGRRERFTGR